MGVREGAVHKHKQGAVYEQQLPGAQVAGQEDTVSLYWGNQGQMSLCINKSTALISAAKCSQGLEDHPSSHWLL